MKIAPSRDSEAALRYFVIAAGVLILGLVLYKIFSKDFISAQMVRGAECREMTASVCPRAEHRIEVVAGLTICRCPRPVDAGAD